MEFITGLMEIVLNIDKHLVDIVNDYQSWTYFIMFLILFAETGFVITPFLPGDSLLFAMGALIAKSETELSLIWMFIVLILAAVSGDFVNYEFGKYFGKKVFTPTSKVFKQSYLQKTEAFYEKNGNKTIIYARFIPIVRTFAPFVAGVSKMSYQQFGKYNIFGGILWVALFLLFGYFFGQISFIKNNFSLVVLAIIFISLLLPAIEHLRKT